MPPSGQCAVVPPVKGQLKEFPADYHFEERPLAGGADVAGLPVELKAVSNGFVALFPL